MTSLRCSILMAFLVFSLAVPLAAEEDTSSADERELSLDEQKSDPTSGVQWDASRDGQDDVHRVRFAVADGACAYQLMSTPDLLVTHLRHVYGAEIHDTRADFQDVTFSERFFLVARGESRYHRTLVASERVEWRLIHGRQAVHDGYWQVRPTAGPEGSSIVIFENRIRARKRFHQRMLRGIQRRTMEDVVEVTQVLCGAG